MGAKKGNPMSDFPRDDLIRMTRLDAAQFELRGDEQDGRTMVGYPIVFNRWTEINGWEGQFLERVHPGAVSKTLRENRDQVKVLFNHGMDPSIGEKPLGRATVMEADDTGVYVEVPLARTSYNEDIAELLRSGVLDGMSFRFSVVKEDWNDTPERSNLNPDGLPERTIRELRLYELGPVTFPAYSATSVGVRSRQAYELIQDRLQTVDEPEAVLDDTSDESPAEPPTGALERKWRAGSASMDQRLTRIIK